MMTQPRGARRRGRPGFTLVEILVVLAIIAVLASLTSVAVLRWIDTGKQQTTEATIQKVKKELDRQVKLVLKKTDDESIPTAVVTLAGNDMNRARVIWKKLRLRQEFPETLAEATLHPSTIVASLAGVTDLNPLYTTVPNIQNLNANSASAALLLLSLKRNRGGKAMSEDDLGANNVLDTDNDGFKEIIDSWGNPVLFCRWPTGSAAVDASNPATVNSRDYRSRDPLDPDGTLLNPVWYNTAQRQQFEALCHIIKPATAVGGGANGAFIIPVIASGGRDGVLGLDPTTLTTSPANNTNINDNIYSYTLR